MPVTPPGTWGIPASPVVGRPSKRELQMVRAAGRRLLFDRPVPGYPTALVKEWRAALGVTEQRPARHWRPGRSAGLTREAAELPPEMRLFD